MDPNNPPIGILVTIRNAQKPDQLYCEKIIPLSVDHIDLLLKGDFERAQYHTPSAIHHIESAINRLFHQVVTTLPKEIQFFDIEYRFIVPVKAVEELLEVHQIPINRYRYGGEIQLPHRQKNVLRMAFFQLTDFFNRINCQNPNPQQQSQSQSIPANIVIEKEEIVSISDQIRIFSQENPPVQKDNSKTNQIEEQINIINDGQLERAMVDENNQFEEDNFNPTEQSSPPFSRAETNGPLSPDSQNDNNGKKVNIKLIVRTQVLEIARTHAMEESHHETGGALLGTVIERDSTLWVMITGLIKGKFMRHHKASLVFTSETWAYFWRNIDQDEVYADESLWKMVGWYHTHPSYGVFLSTMDMFIQNNFFALPYHIALVIDPVRDTYGFFTWEGKSGQVHQKPHQEIEFYDETQMKSHLKSVSVPMPSIEIPSSQDLYGEKKIEN